MREAPGEARVGGFSYPNRDVFLSKHVFVCIRVYSARIHAPPVAPGIHMEYDEFVPEYNGLVGHHGGQTEYRTRLSSL